MSKNIPIFKFISQPGHDLWTALYLSDFQSHGSKNGKNVPKIFFLFFFGIITLAATSFLKENYLNKEKTPFS